MFKIVKDNINIDFMSKRNFFYLTSGLFCLISLLLIIFKGFNYGIDFAGGTVVQTKFNKVINLDDIRGSLSDANIGGAIIQNYGSGSEVLIRIVKSEIDLKKLSDNIEEALQKKFGKDNFVIERVEQVGPQVGAQLRAKAFYSIIYALIGILIYVAFRFEWVYSAASVIAVFHDVLVTCGVLCLFGKEMDLTILAALLTILGYSLNDTIVIFDRVREVLKNTAGKQKLYDIINRALNETLSRTILTSSTVFMAVLALYLFGGSVINGFAFALLIGSIIGVYSTVGVACAMVYSYKTFKSSGKA